MRNGRRVVALIGALALAVFAFAGCGGGDGDEDEDQATSVIEEAATSTDPADCTRLLTQNFVEQAELEEGEAAVQSCEEDAEDTAEVDVTNVEVSDDEATAEVAFTGGSFDSQTVAVSLIKDGDQWKIDQIDSFVEFDRAAFFAAFEESLNEDGELTAEQAECFLAELDKGTDEQIHRVFLGGNPEVFVRLLQACGVG